MARHTNNSESAIVGKAYDKPKELVAKYAKSNISLLFLGETGSGKELFANLYMEKNGRTGKKRTINCSVYNDELLRSEIFGHVIGAYTHAIKPRKGLIETCEGGIVFLDELDSASPGFQSLILRVVENNSYTKLGSDAKKESNVLFIGAIKNLSAIRDDLIHRFNIIFIPPLQNFDIPVIVNHHLGRPLKNSYLNKLNSREYPGNVRELIKQCDKLLVEEGDKIFNKTKEKRSMEGIYFDYDRFRKEIGLWQKHIQPIIDKCDLYGVNYMYRNPVGNIEDIFKGFRDKFSTDELDISYMAGVIDRLKYLKNIDLFFMPGAGNGGIGGETALKLFRIMLKTVIKKGYLFDLLDLLKLLEIDTNFNMIVDVQGVNQESIIDRRPLLNHLLEITPYDEALKKFQKTYAGYYVEKNDGDKTKASKEIGKSSKTLRNYLKG